MLIIAGCPQDELKIRRADQRSFVEQGFDPLETFRVLLRRTRQLHDHAHTPAAPERSQNAHSGSRRSLARVYCR
jgi:hypothetical protein